VVKKALGTIVDFHHKDLDKIVGCRANRIEHVRVIVHISSARFNTASNRFLVKVGSRSNRESSILLFYTKLIFYSQTRPSRVKGETRKTIVAIE
jgi:hypothetical protein